MKYYAFTGEPKDLKSIGFNFKKLYARNYKTYIKDDIIMYVSNQMILEIGNLYNPENQVKIISFILENKDKPHEFWEEYIILPKITLGWRPQYRLTHYGNILNRKDMAKVKSVHTRKMKDFFDNEKREVSKIKDIINKKEYEEKQNEIWEDIENLEGAKSGVALSYKLVKDILALNNLKPLEIVRVKENF